MNVRQKKALAALLQYPTHKTAAQACGLSERQLRTYLQDNEFRAEYDRMTTEILDEAATACKQAMNPAIAALVEIVTDKEAAAAARTAAARTILDAGLRLHEAVDVTSRLERLERYAAEGDK